MSNSVTMTNLVALTGFLGSGKTTLLQRLVRTAQEAGKKVAVILNELGEVNVEAALLEGQVQETAVRELLGGCICCTVSGDLSLTLLRLIEEERPDVVLVEATGAANPLELMEAVTETSMLIHVRLSAVVTVVDGPFFAEQSAKGAGKTWRLLREQVRGASLVVLNKADLLEKMGLVSGSEVIERIRACNPHAPIVPATRCDIPVEWQEWLLENTSARVAVAEMDSSAEVEAYGGANSRFRMAYPAPHDSHNHLLVHTMYPPRPLDREPFTRAMNDLSATVYRGKGIVTFSDTGERVMFQFAYRQLELIPITPQKEVPDVIVLIGEGLSAPELERLFIW